MKQPRRKWVSRRAIYRRNRRRQGIWLSILLLLTILSVQTLHLLTPDREYSDQENRKLAQAPAFSWAALTDGSYFSGLESYLADQFAGRDFWISLQLRFGRFLGQREFNGVLLCEDDYLMEPPAAPNEASLSRNLEAVNAFADAHPEVTMQMAVIPNAACVLSEKLPENIPVRDQKADLQRLAERLRGVTFLDATPALEAHSGEALYYRTDHHWTSLAARYAFEALAPSMGISQPVTDYEVYPVSTNFEGTLASRSGCHAVRDQIEVYVPKSDVDFYVVYEESKETTASLYARDCLEQKDQYTVFFGGNHPRIDITTTAETGRSLLLFKDSYANCFVQFLTPYYERIVIIDPRYYYGNAEAILSRQGITDVLYLYNANTFFADSSLADVLQG